MKAVFILFITIALVAIAYQIFFVTDDYELKTSFRAASVLDSVENVQKNGIEPMYAFNLLFNLVQKYQSDMNDFYPPITKISFHRQFRNALGACMSSLRNANRNLSLPTVNAAISVCRSGIEPLR